MRQAAGRHTVAQASEDYWSALASKYREGVYHTMFSRYVRACTMRDEAPLPVTRSKLICMLGDYVVLDGLAASSLWAVYSAVKKAVTKGLGEPWVSASDDDDCKEFIQFTQKVVPTVTGYSQELRRVDLQVIYDYLKDRLDANDCWAWTVWTILLAGNNTGCRADEMLNGNMRWDQIKRTLSRATGLLTGLSILLPLRKMMKTTIDERECYTYIAHRSDIFDAVKALEKLASLTGAAPGVSPTPVFMHVRTSGKSTGNAFTTNTFVRHLREHILTPAEFEDVHLYAGHSMRSGAATDMLADGVDWPTVARVCGWRSDSAMRRYVRHGDEFAEKVNPKGSTRY